MLYSVFVHGQSNSDGSSNTIVCARCVLPVEKKSASHTENAALAALHYGLLRLLLTVEICIAASSVMDFSLHDC